MTRTKDIEELFRLYYRPLCLYAAKYLPDTGMAEDVVQESFIAFWDKVKEGKKPGAVKPYLYRIVHNKCLDALKGMPDYERWQGMEMDAVDEDTESRSFLWARLWTAIGKLPEKRREIFLMNKRDGMTYSEIASQLGISENTVHAQITKALKALREGCKNIFAYFFL